MEAPNHPQILGRRSNSPLSFALVAFGGAAAAAGGIAGIAGTAVNAAGIAAEGAGGDTGGVIIACRAPRLGFSICWA